MEISYLLRSYADRYSSLMIKQFLSLNGQSGSLFLARKPPDLQRSRNNLKHSPVTANSIYVAADIIINSDGLNTHEQGGVLN